MCVMSFWGTMNMSFVWSGLLLCDMVISQEMTSKDVQLQKSEGKKNVAWSEKCVACQESVGELMFLCQEQISSQKA